MEVRYNVTGERRKEMVKVVSEALGGWKPKYLLMPSHAYQVGDFNISKDGTLSFPGRTDAELVEPVLEALAKAGFECEAAGEAEEQKTEEVAEMPNEAEEPVNTSQFAGPYEMPWDEDCNQKEMTDEEMATAMEEQDRLIAEAAAQQAEREEKAESQAEEQGRKEVSDQLAISLPRESFTDEALENLDHLLESKGQLIKKAFGIEEATYTATDDRITFNWLIGEITPEKAKAYQDFIGKLCEMARTLKRVNAKAKVVDNEKYAFRCFLLRLGLIGNEYKATRKILMANLSGNASFKSGKKKEAAEHEKG